MVIQKKKKKIEIKRKIIAQMSRLLLRDKNNKHFLRDFKRFTAIFKFYRKLFTRICDNIEVLLNMQITPLRNFASSPRRR